MLTRNFKRFLKKKHSSRTRDFNKKYEGEGKKKSKEVTYYECKKLGHIRSECPKLKFKKKRAKDKKKASKLLGMTPLNRRRKRNKKKWSTFVS